MKKLFWSSFVLDEKLLATDRASVWRMIDELGMNDFDINELEFMFGDRQSGASALFGPEDSAISKKRAPTRVQVLDENRRRQVCVMLARLPAIPETIRAVTEMDDVRLNKDQVELLLANAPSAEELAALRSAAAEMEHDADESLNWDDAEAFILRLSAVPCFALRLQIWAFENSFDERFEVFQQAATDVREACLALRRCPCIQRLLALGLSVGNYLNAGQSMLSLRCEQSRRRNLERSARLWTLLSGSWSSKVLVAWMSSSRMEVVPSWYARRHDRNWRTSTWSSPRTSLRRTVS